MTKGLDKSSNGHVSPFERIKKTSDAGNEYWESRELAHVLEYTQYRNFEGVIEKAKLACVNSGHRIEDHFADISKMVDIGSGAVRKIKETLLSRYACYLIIQNADPRKEIVALGQTYFSNTNEEYIAKIREIIFDHIISEIDLAHHAYTLLMAISENAESLKRSRYKAIIGLMQKQALDAMVISVCKLYERKNERYKNFSIHTAICYLDKLYNSNGILIDNISDLFQLKDFLISKESCLDINLFNYHDANRIPGLLLEYFRKICPKGFENSFCKNHELEVRLNALKMLRDKRIAHDEDEDIDSPDFPKTNLEGVRQLLAFAQTFVNIIGYGFFGHSQDGEIFADDYIHTRNRHWKKMDEMMKTLGNS